MNLLTREATGVAARCPFTFPQCRTQQVRVEFATFWLHETGRQAANSELGAVFDSGFDAQVEITASPRPRLCVKASNPLPGGVDNLVLFLLGIKSRGDDVLRALGSWDAFQQLDRKRKLELEAVFGRVRSPHIFGRVAGRVAAFVELRNRILRAALTALEWDYRERAAADPAWNPPFRATLQLQLPVLERRQWSQRLNILPNCDVEAGEAGAVVVRPRDGQSVKDYNLHYQTALALGAGSAPENVRPNFQLSFSDDRTLDRDRLQLVLQPMLATYGFSGNVLDALPPHWQRVSAEFSLRVPGSAARAWSQTPKERTIAFNRFFADVSQAAQRALRSWIPYIRCEQRQIYSAREELYALLVYQVSRPFCQRRRPELTYDPMSPTSVRQACRHIRGLFAGKLAEVRQFLLAHGRTEDAVRFHTAKLSPILKRVQTGNRTLLNLLAADSTGVDRLRKLGAWCRKLQAQPGGDGTPAAPSYRLLRAATDVNRVFRASLRRLSAAGETMGLANLLLVIGSAAASEHLGQPAPITVNLRLANAESDQPDDELILRNTVRIDSGGVDIINVSL